MACVKEEMTVDRMVVLGEFRLPLEERRSCCMLLFFRERNVDWRRERAGGEGKKKEAHVRRR